MYKVLLQFVFCLLVLFKSSQSINTQHHKTHSLNPIHQQNKLANYRNQQSQGIPPILNEEIKISDHLLHQSSPPIILNDNLGKTRKTYFSNPKEIQAFLQLQDDVATTDEAQTAAQLEETRKANEEILKKLEEERKLYEQRKIEEEKRKKEGALREALKKMAQDDFEKIQNFMDKIKSKLNSFQQEVDNMGNQIGTAIQGEIKTSIQKIQNQLVTHYKLVLEHAATGDLEHRKITDQMTAEINEEVKQLFQKTHLSFCNIKELTIMLWEYQIEDNTKALNKLQNQADDLQRKLPPPGSICNEYLECGICNANPKCGWCLTQNKCVEGDNIGPLNEPCPLYDYDICRGFNCAFYKDCKSCLSSDSRCGWCDDLGSGAQLCLERSANYQGCTPDDWYHSQGLKQECPVVTVAPFLDLKAAEEKEKFEKLAYDRKRVLEAKENQLSQTQKNIRESHNQLLKLKQSILSFKKDNEQLNQQIKNTQDEIANCQSP